MTQRSGADRAGQGNPRPTGTGRRLTPGAVFLAVALIGSAAFVLYSVTVRDPSQIPLLAAGSAVLGIVFIAMAIYALRVLWRAGTEGRAGRALAVAIGGGISAIIGAGCLAAAVILLLLSQTPTA